MTDTMIKQMPKYDSYSATEIDWIGDIPTHWRVKKAKFLFDEVNERSIEGNEELLSVSHLTGVSRRSEKNVTMFQAEDYTGSKLCKPGDLVMNIMWAWMGALGVSNLEGIVSPSYGVFRTKRPNEFNSKFLEYLLKTPKYIEHYNKVSTGLHSSRLRFYADMFFDMKLGFPEFEEQNLIIEFLDKKTSQIDEAIAVKKKQIDLLKERKKIIIQQAITQGLNPDVPMKDSGVDWIGQIPKHWAVKKTKYLGRISSGDAITNSELLDNGLYEVYGGNGFLGYANKFNVEGKSIVIGRVGALCGNVRFIEEKKWVSDNALVLKLSKASDYEYISILLKAANLNKLSSSNAQPLITGSKVMNTFLPIPPGEERERLKKYISKQNVNTTLCLEKLTLQVEYLKEYKATLINSTVTGKIKVTDLA